MSEAGRDNISDRPSSSVDADSVSGASPQPQTAPKPAAIPAPPTVPLKTLKRSAEVLEEEIRVLVRAVRAVGRLVAEERLGDTLPVAALQLPVRTHGLVRLQVGKDALRLW